MNPLLEAVSCPWAKRVYLSSDQSSLCACVHRSTHVSGPRTVQTSHGMGCPQRAYPSVLVAYAVGQDGAATCGILQQILLPADLINSLQTERLIPHQTPTYPFLPPLLPPTVSSHPLPLPGCLILVRPHAISFPHRKCLLFHTGWENVVSLEKSNEGIFFFLERQSL